MYFVNHSGIKNSTKIIVEFLFRPGWDRTIDGHLIRVVLYH